MAIQIHNGVRYEILLASYDKGFAAELYRLRRFRKRKLVAEVYRPEASDEPTFEVFIEDPEAQAQFVFTFIEWAKDRLQRDFEEWVRNFPEHRDRSS